jgi:hypothetical protein
MVKLKIDFFRELDGTEKFLWGGVRGCHSPGCQSTLRDIVYIGCIGGLY